ncbi:filaggrin-like [Rhineura floridana]|uniref:filaggrin-like n=1 Tax=Rhineura floridana TaxID=261503 RepID=UPI002AC813A6|nr:filaggrin-like [Rhineura floridana]
MDETEPTLDPVILESSNANEDEVDTEELRDNDEINEEEKHHDEIYVGEEEKHNGEINEVIQHQESGDQDVPKIPSFDKDVMDQTVHADSKSSVFKHKELMDQNEQPDFSPGSVTASLSSLRKQSRSSQQQQLPGQESRHGSQQLVGHESRRGSQHSQQLPGQESRHSQQLPGRESRQGSLHSQHLVGQESRHSQQLPGQESCRGSHHSQQLIGQESRHSQQLPGQESRHSQQLPGQESRHGSQQLVGHESRRGSQHSQQLPGQESRHSQQLPGRESRQGSLHSQHLVGQESRHSQQLPGQESRRGSHHSQQLIGQESRHSQQSISQQVLQSRKPSRTQPINEVETKEDMTWISQRTGKVMKCESQQTSRVWEHKPLAQILQSFGQVHPKSKSAEKGAEQLARKQSEVARLSSQDLKGQASQYDSQQQPKEDVSWISKRTGKLMKCTSQQTSKIWERKPLAEILCLSRQPEVTSDAGEKVVTAEEESVAPKDSEVKPTEVAEVHLSSEEVQESQHDSQQVEQQESQHGGQLVEGEVAIPDEKSIDETLQTDSKVSFFSHKELMDQNEQTDFPPGSVRTSITSLKKQQESRHGSQQAEGQVINQMLKKDNSLKVMNSREMLRNLSGSQPLEETESQICRQQPEVQESQISSQQPEVPESQRGSQEPEVPGSRKGSQQPEVQESRRGSQQPEVPGSRKGSQQPGVQESRRGSQQPEVQDSLRVSQQEPEVPGSQKSSQPVVQQESQQQSQPPVGDVIEQPGASESQGTIGSMVSCVEGADIALQTYSIISLEDGIWLNRKTGKFLMSHGQQTRVTSLLSVNQIAMEDAAIVPKPSGLGTDGEEVGAKASGMHQSSTTAEVKAGEDQQPLLGQESHHDSQPALSPSQESHHDSQPPLGQESSHSNQQASGSQKEGELQGTDDVKKVLSHRLSEATLQNIAAADGDDNISQRNYSTISLEKGSWVNQSTGRKVVSQHLQTEESSFKKLGEDTEAPQNGDHPLEEHQTENPELSGGENSEE